MNIHIFNPEHDIALASDSWHWTSPKAGRQLRHELGWLPAIWATPGDIVVVEDIDVARSAAHSVLGEDGIKCVFTTLSSLRYDIAKAESNAFEMNVCPWGWDKSIVSQLRRAGITSQILPCESQLNAQRSLSDRATSANLLAHLVDRLPEKTACGVAHTATSVDDVYDLFCHYGQIVLKSPWSSSGRGVRFIHSESDWNQRSTTEWATKVINTNGHIMVEQYQHKVLDFGMEFVAQADGRVRFECLSLFNVAGGAYEGSLVMSEQEKMSLMSKYISPHVLSTISAIISEWMSRFLAGVYVGPFGVDMMIVCPLNGNGNYVVDPCVEINLRRTMGHVAYDLHRHLLRNGVMNISYSDSHYMFSFRPFCSGGQSAY